MKIHAMTFNNGALVKGFEKALCGYHMKPSDMYYQAYAYKQKFNWECCKKCLVAAKKIGLIKQVTEVSMVKEGGKY